MSYTHTHTHVALNMPENPFRDEEQKNKHVRMEMNEPTHVLVQKLVLNQEIKPVVCPTGGGCPRLHSAGDSSSLSALRNNTANLCYVVVHFHFPSSL